MSEERNYVVGLDIGTTKICVIVGEKNEFGKINILGVGKEESTGVNRGVVNNIQKTRDAIVRAVKTASDQSGILIKHVHVGIAGQHIHSQQQKTAIVRPNDKDNINQSDIDRLMEETKKLALEPNEQIIHVIAQEFMADKNVTKDPIGMPGVRFEGNFHVVSGNVTAIANIRKCVEDAGLIIDGIHLEPIASSEAVLSDDEKEAGVVLVDIGGGTTDIAIFHDGLLRHTHVHPFGGNSITDDIKNGCSILQKQAELLKVLHGHSSASFAPKSEILQINGFKERSPKKIHTTVLAKIIECRLLEIFEAVVYQIKSSGYEHKLAAGIVVTGGGSLLKFMKQFVEYVTRLDARVGSANEHLGAGMTDEVKSPLYATGVGLLMLGLESNLHFRNNNQKQENEFVMDKKDAKIGPKLWPFGSKEKVEDKVETEHKKDGKSKLDGIKDVLNGLWSDPNFTDY
jgi:cell division protein FtsA